LVAALRAALEAVPIARAPTPEQLDDPELRRRLCPLRTYRGLKQARGAGGRLQPG
jgi:hypothetical protein